MSNICFIVRSFSVFWMECKFSEQFFSMKTDVEDINIHQIIERLSMSCIESSGEPSSRSFTLFKNDHDFRERFDSAAVSESISSSKTNSSSTSLSVLAPNISPRFPLLRRPFHRQYSILSIDELAPNTSLVVLVCCSFNELNGTWLSDLVFHGLSDAAEASTSGFLTLHRETKFINGFDYPVTLSSPDPCWARFATAAVQAVELKWLILNKVNKWFHSSVSMYLIWISNNQSRATLWVLETCRIVGLLPFMIILIAALVSSNTYNNASAGNLCGSPRARLLWYVFPWRTATIRSHNQVQVYHPTSILCPRKRFVILLNCAKLKFVSSTSNWLEQMYDFHKCTMFHLT